ncbi:hypothetical protein FEM48_Zijuj01G0106600 [Ziziphus jujuba var. spinosa]|uniref:KIB1-4 beta-propeller domain-containing protein n=1 Tax=Ziziphus jujuba var. spinosa TaxID=714518 RepID=A0A978W0S7_ZIZJJ|nr:hypothetical protein FEM48_Zijuj01G0106600 [Ziziphus jujuba var. spinosa]
MGDEKWAIVDDGHDMSDNRDIAFHNGSFYTVNDAGLTIAVDPSSLQVSHRESLSGLLEVLGIRKWVFVKHLGDQVMFVGSSCRFSVWGKDFAGLKTNHVYFPDEYCCGVLDDFPDLEDDVAQPLKPFVCYCKVFWPTPTWLEQRPS